MKPLTPKVRDRKFSLKQLIGTNLGTLLLAILLTTAFVMAPAVINVYLDDLPATASFVLKGDGTNYWAVRYDGYKLSEVTSFKTLMGTVQTTLPNGGVIRLADHTTFSTDPFAITANHITLEGGGWHSIIKLKDSAPTPLGAGYNAGIQIDADYVTLRNFKFDFNYRTHGVHSGIEYGISTGRTGMSSDRHDFVTDMIEVYDFWANGIHLGGHHYPTPDRFGYDMTVEGCYIHKSNNPAIPGNGSNGIAAYYAYRIRILHNTIDEVQEIGMDFYSMTSELLIDGNIFKKGSYNYTAISLERCSKTTAVNNIIETGSRAIYISQEGLVAGTMSANASSGQKNIVLSSGHGTYFTEEEYVYIYDNNNWEVGQLDSISGNTLTMHENLRHNYTTAASGKVGHAQIDVIVDNNQCRGNRDIGTDSHGIMLYCTAGNFMVDVKVTNNIIERFGTAAIAKSGISAYTGTNAQNLLISGNTIRYCTEEGIYSQTSYAEISSNVCYENTNSGIKTFGDKNRIFSNKCNRNGIYGINLVSGADYNEVLLNECLNNVSTQIFDNGTGNDLAHNIIT